MRRLPLLLIRTKHPQRLRRLHRNPLILHSIINRLIRRRIEYSRGFRGILPVVLRVYGRWPGFHWVCWAESGGGEDGCV